MGADRGYAKGEHITLLRLFCVVFPIKTRPFSLIYLKATRLLALANMNNSPLSALQPTLIEESALVCFFCPSILIGTRVPDASWSCSSLND